ncbi:MAG: 4a-hydroxytetrahydrobiopterin dehydratase [Candidatus Levyibacteriota bacterium]
MDLTIKHCVPCEGGTPPFTLDEENTYINEIPSWIILRDGVHKLRKQFQFKNFKEAIQFVNNVAKIAEEEGHHPDIYIFYNKVQIDLFTHAVGGLSENDFIMASKINSIS